MSFVVAELEIKGEADIFASLERVAIIVAVLEQMGQVIIHRRCYLYLLEDVRMTKRCPFRHE